MRRKHLRNSADPNMSPDSPSERVVAAKPDAKSAQNSESATAVSVSEDSALASLKQSDVTADTLVLLSKNPVAAKSRKVMLALVQHRRTPRHVSIPLLRRLFTFDLMQVSLTPAVPADLKRAAEEQMLMRLESLPMGQKISLARRASGRIAAELLRDKDKRVASVALENARLVEHSVVAALMRTGTQKPVFEMVSEHAKWSQRREIQIALLRSDKTPLERARQFAMHFSEDFLREVVPPSRRPALLERAAGKRP